ncbi:hypothetical protein BGZ96_000301 [Linnemannia gamsii]|uniref:Uncharacterized protein n=1 Tax=Linnemannia gamsii TaxID=64522 RepID=A0ABQ7JPI1_9FUNG|nr:hypothetical protein BGZ96_000301 [Linnemannia gamsii]
MTKVRDSSKQSYSSSDSVTTDSNTGSPRQGAVSPDQTTTINKNDSGTSTDSTHQSAEATHEKNDQKLEASDPDLLTTTDDSSTVDQVQDAVGTPINSEIREEEPVSLDDDVGGSKDDDDDGELGSGSLAMMEEGNLDLESNRVYSTTLAGHVRGVPGQSKHRHYDEHDQDQSATGSVPEEIESNTAETNRHGYGQHLSEDKGRIEEVEGEEVEELESTKHAKRMADDLAKERHDYVAGAYKSPFRHTHKAEKVGREER